MKGPTSTSWGRCLTGPPGGLLTRTYLRRMFVRTQDYIDRHSIETPPGGVVSDIEQLQATASLDGMKTGWPVRSPGSPSGNWMSGRIPGMSLKSSGGISAAI